MVLNEIEVEQQLQETGNSLLHPPSSIDDLLNLLDKLEHLLVNVDQAPSISMQDALLPPMKALISDALLRNSDPDVKVYVASCLSEITRITAPDAPYSDAHMKEIFQLVVASMEKLSHVSSRSYTKAVSILETLAKVRSCLMMLDLELNELIIKMFQYFLKIIRSNHTHTVFLCMERIMTLIIDESEDISMDLLTSLLASVRKDNQSVSPTASKLGEKVITNCAAKLKPYLKEVLQSENIAKDDYASVVESLCGNMSQNFVNDHSNDSEDHLNGVSLVQVVKRLSPSSPSPGEVSQRVDGISISLSNTSGSTKDVASDMQNDSSKKKDHCSIIQKSESTATNGNADPAINLEREPASFPRKRGRKPNSLMNPEEGYDHWVSQGRKPAKMSSRKKPQDKGIEVLSENIELSQKTDGMSGGSQPKRGQARKSSDTNSLRLDKEVLNSANEEKNLSEEVSLKKLSEGRNNEEMKKHKHSRKIQCAAKTSKERSPPTDYVLDGKSSVRLGLEGKPQLKSTKKRIRNISKDISLAKTEIRKRKLARGISDADVSEASCVMKVKSCDSDGSFEEDIPQKNLKKKRTPRKEVLSPDTDIGPELVGSRVKIWWPLDCVFYEAVVHSYFPNKRKHKVLYVDGEVEILNLRKERWELIEDDVFSDKDAQTDTAKADSSSDKVRAKKGKGSANPEAAKQRKVKVKRSGSTSIRKRRARTCGSNTDVSVADKTLGDSTRAGTSLEDDSKSCSGNLKMKSRVKTEQMTPENSSCDDGKTEGTDDAVEM